MVILHRWVVSFICSFIRPPLSSPSSNKQLEPSNSSCHDSFSKHNTSSSSSSSILVGEGISPTALCCVCLSRLKDWGAVRALPCRHEFHKACIERWFVGRVKTCPICRLRVDDVALDGFCSVEQEDGNLTEEMLIWFSSFHAAGF